MTVTRVIRYRTSAETAEENVRLIEAVFTELAVLKPKGLQYSSYRLDDGVTFVHVVQTEGDGNPLFSVAAFGAFQAGIGDRCVEGPVVADATTVGSYG
jgi:hypothetical protein